MKLQKIITKILYKLIKLITDSIRMLKVELGSLKPKLAQFIKSQKYTPLKRLILVRSAQSIGNLSGTLTGWTDIKLTDLGRRQAFTLSQALTQHNFKSIYSSDLIRCQRTAFISLAFPSQSRVKLGSLLRQINFGKMQGIHFDSMGEKDKEKINSIGYQAEGGQSWKDVKERFQRFCSKQIYQTNSAGKSEEQEIQNLHLVYTHGGLICTILRDFGVSSIISNCSVAGVIMKDRQDGEVGIKSHQFLWEFPQVDQ